MVGPYAVHVHHMRRSAIPCFNGAACGQCFGSARSNDAWGNEQGWSSTEPLAPIRESLLSPDNTERVPRDHSFVPFTLALSKPSRQLQGVPRQKQSIGCDGSSDLILTASQPKNPSLDVLATLVLA